MLENKKHIIFDLDGTLIDSAPDLCKSVNLMLTHLGKKRFGLKVVRKWIGNGARVLVHRALSGSKEVDLNIDDKIIDDGLEIFFGYYEKNLCVETKLYDGVKETLEYLYDKHYALSIATNKPHRFVAPILQGLQIENLFSATLGGDSLDVKKPDPKPLIHICSQTNFTIDESVMIGDSKNDILAAKNCNMDVIALTYGYNQGDDVTIFEPTFIVKKFAKIQQLL